MDKTICTFWKPERRPFWFCVEGSNCLGPNLPRTRGGMWFGWLNLGKKLTESSPVSHNWIHGLSGDDDIWEDQTSPEPKGHKALLLFTSRLSSSFPLLLCLLLRLLLRIYYLSIFPIHETKNQNEKAVGHSCRKCMTSSGLSNCLCPKKDCVLINSQEFSILDWNKVTKAWKTIFTFYITEIGVAI